MNVFRIGDIPFHYALIGMVTFPPGRCVAEDVAARVATSRGGQKLVPVATFARLQKIVSHGIIMYFCFEDVGGPWRSSSCRQRQPMCR